MKYLLDTNMIIDVINKTDLKLDKKLKQSNPNDFSVSVITYSELVFGYNNISDEQERLKKKTIVASALSAFNIINYDKACAEKYGLIRANLVERKLYKKKNELDLQIAATAQAHSLVVLTKDSDFDDIENLKTRKSL
jgi:predicted nucleic acid-binding protein